jgi:multiple sugar transport system permease protein
MFKQRADNETLTGLAFISPWLAGFALFILAPVVYSFYLSLCNFDGLAAPEFIGAGNYTRMLGDDRFYTSVWNTIYITFLGVPVTLLCSLALALLLNQQRRGIGIYRTLIYLPCLTPVVAMSVLWVWLFNPEVGLINYLIRSVNDLLPAFLAIPTPGWFTDAFWAKPGLIVMGVWTAGGTMLIFLAALQDVPASLYESADIDGASWFTKQINVTLPLISPVIFFNLLMGIINGAQYFTQAYIVAVASGAADNPGVPQDSTLFYVVYLFAQAFQNWNMGYASALAWTLFFLTLGLSLIAFRVSAKRVYYSGE